MPAGGEIRLLGDDLRRDRNRKELLAQSIHNASRRANGPFLAINCAAIPENLLEGLLFGTEKGAYTGAERRQGYFEQANNGTLLLDELNSMNINLQAKLLARAARRHGAPCRRQFRDSC